MKARSGACNSPPRPRVFAELPPPSLTLTMQRVTPWRRRFGEDTMEKMLGFMDTLLRDGLASKQVRRCSCGL